MTDQALVHGSCVGWQDLAVLLRGPSGAGKSDLALRLIELGGQLVADDQVLLRADGDRLLAAPPPALAGLLEVRGLGILSLGYRAPLALGLVVDLVAEAQVERLPERSQVMLAGCRLPRIRLCPWPASAASKVRLAVRLVEGTILCRS